MGKTLVKFLSESEGACCQFGFIRRYRHLTAPATAKVLGIGLRTLEETRTLIAEGAIACEKKENCECKS